MKSIMSIKYLAIALIFSVFSIQACNTKEGSENEKVNSFRLITLDPGHFHAALVQKSMFEDVDSTVHVYAPEGPEVESHLGLIEKYNLRDELPTSWNEKVYLGNDYLEKMLNDKLGNIVILAGNNKKKTHYIHRSIVEGLNVLADKPMAITQADFDLLKEAFVLAKQKDLLLYDIMTERYEINSLLQKEISRNKGIFGELQKGSLEEPAITKRSVHHYYKEVSGSPLLRPKWYYDVEQVGDGVVDVTTHFVDLIQWQAFPEQALDYENDIQMLDAKRWPTMITKAQYSKSTGAPDFPDFLHKDVKNDVLHVFANGEMNYTIKGTHAKVAVEWNFQAPEGSGDTHLSLMRGTKANLAIRQGPEQGYKPVLYIEPLQKDFSESEVKNIQDNLAKITEKYPGVEFKRQGSVFEVVIPDQYKEGHEAHFSKVAEKYLGYLKNGNIPAWEVPNMLAKYYTTTQALEKALGN